MLFCAGNLLSPDRRHVVLLLFHRGSRDDLRRSIGGEILHLTDCHRSGASDAEKLVEIQRRLELGGIRTRREEGVECCYARQTKFWVADPDRVLWEIYVVHEDLDEPGGDTVPDAAQLPAEEPAVSRIVWQHELSEPIPTQIPHDEHSVHEAVLEGTANLAAASDRLPALLAEVFRVLRPGGELRLHGLTSDVPLPEPLPALATAHFTVGGVALREIRIVGHKPGHRPATRSHTAIYLGPLAEVTDGFGHPFRRGEPVALNIHDWRTLSRSAAAGSFLFL